MRFLGILIASFITFYAIGVYVRHKYLRPWLSRRHLAAMERENARLDALLSDEIKPKRRRRT